MYGNPHIISRKYIRDLLSLSKVTGYSSLVAFSRKLRGIYASLEDGGYAHELASGGLLETIIGKLPSDIQSKWGRNVVKAFPNAMNLRDFDARMHRIVKGEMIVNHARHEDQTHHTYDSKSGQQTKDTSVRSSKALHPPTIITVTCQKSDEARPEKPYQEESRLSKTLDIVNNLSWLFCGEKHRLPDCIVFQSKTLEERAEVVKKIGCCFRCLIKGHIIKDCSSKKSCGIDGCKFKQHRLIHGAPRVFMKTTSEKIVPAMQRDQPKAVHTVNVKISTPEETTMMHTLMDFWIPGLNAPSSPHPRRNN